MVSVLAAIAMASSLNVEDWVSRHGVSVGSGDVLADSARKMLSRELESVQIVGLGEASHGVSEFFKMKSSAIKYLVAEENYSLIFIEATFGEVVYLNQYISGERNDVDKILNGMPLWYFKVEEFRELLKWLRDYNQSHGNKVSLYGMEMQYADRSLDYIKGFLEKVDGGNSEVWEKFGLNRVGGATAGAKEFIYLWQQMTDDVLQEHFQLLVGLRALFLSNKDEYVAKSSEAEYEMAFRHVIVLEQFISAAMQSEEAIKHQMRDYFMFLNVEWVRAHLKNPKTVVWAHNEHIWKQAGNGGYDVLDRQLERRYGQSYFAIGFDFGHGVYRAPSNDGWEHNVPEPKPNSLSFRMSELGKPHFLLNIRGASRAGENIPELVTLRASSGGYTPMQDGKLLLDREYSLMDRYDAVLYVDKISVPKVLK